MKVGIVCSTGGHLAQLVRLEGWWRRCDRFWVTYDKADARELLRGERVYWVKGREARSWRLMAQNAAFARDVLRDERPDVLVSNGAGVALPFFAFGALTGTRLVYLEVPDRLDGPSLTGRLLYPLVDRMVVPNARQLAFYPDATVLGMS